MKEFPLQTEQKILKAAREEFIQNGFQGARMQVIADKAEVNKALLHYYFRTKEKLYLEVLRKSATSFWGTLDEIYRKEEIPEDIEFIIRLIVETFIKIMSSNPDYPRMILREIADGGHHVSILIEGVVKTFGQIPKTFITVFKKEVKKGRIKKLEPAQFFFSLMGMCVVTFIIKPVVEQAGEKIGLSINFNEAFYQKRIDTIVEIALHGILQENRNDK